MKMIARYVAACCLLVAPMGCRKSRTPSIHEQQLIDQYRENLARVQAGGDINVGMSEGAFTPLMCAAILGDVKGVRSLLKKGAKLEARDTRGMTALMWAARNGRADVMRILIGAGADVNARSTYGGTALIEAARNLACLKVLLEHGVDVKTHDGASALMSAVGHGRINEVKFLLEAGVEVNALPVSRGDGLGNALMIACYGGSIEMVRLLIEKGADVNARCVQDGRIITALSQAEYAHRFEIVQLLIANGASRDPRRAQGRSAAASRVDR